MPPGLGGVGGGCGHCGVGDGSGVPGPRVRTTERHALSKHTTGAQVMVLAVGGGGREPKGEGGWHKGGCQSPPVPPRAHPRACRVTTALTGGCHRPRAAGVLGHS